MSTPSALPRPARHGDLRRWRAVEYASVPGYRPLLLDLLRPDTAGAVPLVVFLHGGGWHGGSRSVFVPTLHDWDPDPFERIAAAGFAVASVDYRLSGEAPFPAQLEDVSAALTWLREHAGELGLDPGRVAVWGESAGGHLAALLGLTAEGVGAVVDWYGPSDLRAFADDSLASGISLADASAPDAREAQLLGATAREAPGRAALASPVDRVHAQAPPFLLIHGTRDRYVPHRQSERLEAALREQGAHVVLKLVEGADHMWLGSPETAHEVFRLSLDFLRERIGLVRPGSRQSSRQSSRQGGD
ncbi:alpha/beta hydrolase [Kineosporia succinea]|uniref:Acetyl esterase/lipase n=1 Tax=Kineosporia succinea TaxID=84632 RepID=A0ABT9PE89_9ACTN|nr:alpha/beta hydrolase [Kineosporia succinea]MDP9830714.1 acetyl esterase/lipase [Kineosporia succinea]